MPMYCYRSQATGEVVEEVYPMGKAPRRIEREGVHFDRDIAAEQCGRATVSKSLWPKVSHAMGCAPDQIEEFKQYDKQHGVTGCEYLPNGDMKVTKDGRRQWLKAHGYIDRSAFC